MPGFERDTALRVLALTIVSLMLAVIAASAWLRLARAHEECGLWPLCRLERARAPEASATGGEAPLAPMVRAVHRGAASLAVPAIVAVLLIALARAPRDRRAVRGASLLLALAMTLAVVGVLAGGSRTVPVVLANLLGGFAMLAGACCLLPWTRPAQNDDLRPAARLALLAWLLQIVLGALSGLLAPGYAAVIHLAWAIVAASVTARVARRARHAALRGVGNALLALLAAQWILGIGAALSGAPPVLVVIHDLGAAAGLALLSGLSWPRPRT